MNNQIYMIFLVAFVVFASNVTYTLAEIPSADTAGTRISQNFLNVFSILPLSVIALGGIIIFYAIREKKIQENRVTKKLLIIGNCIIVLGIVIFLTYLID